MNPRSDQEFVSFVAAASEGATTPRRLEEALRERYPHAVVRPRLLDGEQIAVWYVYREGRWVPSRELEDHS